LIFKRILHQQEIQFLEVTKQILLEEVESKDSLRLPLNQCVFNAANYRNEANSRLVGRGIYKDNLPEGGAIF